MCRAVDGCAPFIDMYNASSFLECLGRGVDKTGIHVLAWAVMPNHVHLMVRCGEVGLDTFSRSVLVSFAMRYNKGNGRRGHLFQGRFRSVLVEEGCYALELIRYIHLNPIRAGMLDTLDALARYPLTGHRGIVEGCPEKWHDVEALFALIAEEGADAKRIYCSLVREGLGDVDTSIMRTGNMILGKGGIEEADGEPLSSRRYECWGGVLGSKQFALNIIDSMQEKGAFRNRTDISQFFEAFERSSGIGKEALLSRSKLPSVVSARRQAVHSLVMDYGLTKSEAARMMKLTPAAVTKMLGVSIPDIDNKTRRINPRKLKELKAF